jgi:type VI secretion system protein
MTPAQTGGRPAFHHSLFSSGPLAAVFFVCSACQSSGGAVTSGLDSLVAEHLSVEVRATNDMNQGNPVAVDLVVVYDEALLQKLLGLSAKDWFAQREQFKQDFPDLVDIRAWEWVPGQRVPMQRVPLWARRSKGGILFANYSLPGTHRARVDLRKPVRLTLDETTFSMTNR